MFVLGEGGAFEDTKGEFWRVRGVLEGGRSFLISYGFLTSSICSLFGCWVLCVCCVGTVCVGSTCGEGLVMGCVCVCVCWVCVVCV
jgi:hypothetical protein